LVSHVRIYFSFVPARLLDTTGSASRITIDSIGGWDTFKIATGPPWGPEDLRRVSMGDSKFNDITIFSALVYTFGLETIVLVLCDIIVSASASAIPI
jgi:hypothetical protein